MHRPSFLMASSKQITFVSHAMLNFRPVTQIAAYLPPRLLDLNAHDRKCHHVEHVGNMLPCDFYPQVQLVFLLATVYIHSFM